MNPTPPINTEAKCRWCGKTLAEHAITLPYVVKMPCGGLKSGFMADESSPVTTPPTELKEGWFWATDRQGLVRGLVYIEALEDVNQNLVRQKGSIRGRSTCDFTDFVPIPTESEVKEMRATIEKLPETLDGKRVYPGMKLFWKSEAPISMEGITVFAVYDEGDCTFKDEQEEIGIPMEWAYSTREAALSHHSKESEETNGK